MDAPTQAGLSPLARSCLGWDASGRVEITDARGLVREGIDALVRDATFGPPEVRDVARHLIWEAAHELGTTSSSIHDFYMARGQGTVKGFTVPAMNIRGPTYDATRAALRAAKRHEVGALIFELARSEMGYTHQPPEEYATSVLAACIKEEWRQPIFIQGDHFQFNVKRFAAEPTQETEGIRSLIREAVASGFYNIDIDASTLVDLSKPTVPMQQFVNSELTAEMTNLVRGLQPMGVTISVGGEIGEVGKKNSTPQELEAYLDQYLELLKSRYGGVAGVSKVSVQTGTTHGGVVGTDGKVIDVDVDFETLETLSRTCVEEYGLAGCVQHGASTLPDDLFHKFPEAGTAEIHLATGFQNALLDDPAFPSGLKRRIYEYLEKHHADERTPGQTLEQFHYKTRKKCFGPFKRELWDLAPDVKKQLMGTLEERFGFMFRELRVVHTKSMVEKLAKPVRVGRTATRKMRSAP